MRVALRVLGVVPIDGHEEGVDVCLACPDRLLLDAADARHASVELDLAGRRDLQPVVDVAAALLEELEGEREACRRAADVTSEVEVDGERQTGVDDFDRGEPDQRPARVEAVRDRLDPEVEPPARATGPRRRRRGCR